ncbi:sigma-70 family RNA polymerase sigma factor [Sphingomonas sp. PWP1-2]|uniref:sigma-70 family RNA polymerase sigma factor n=1 Tax=Sphingomonas sp. PWP1-2 TaxID=2804558 RepID=UPI003CF8FF22
MALLVNVGLSPAESSIASARAHLIEQLALTGQEDRAAFENVYALTSAKLFGICFRICGERAVAEDVLHDVYMIVWKRAGTYEPCLGSPISWLATIARNRAIDWRRSQTQQGAVTLDDAPDLPDPGIDAETMMLIDEDSRRLLIYLSKLESRQRNAIHSAFFDGYTYLELAERSGVPLSTMKSRIRRGLRQLRKSFEKSDNWDDRSSGAAHVERGSG